MMNFSLPKSLQQLMLCFVLLAALLVGCVPAALAQEKYSFNLPPSADLNYTIKATIRGLILDGTGSIQWTGAREKYRLLFETRTALTGTLLLENSEGKIDRFGLAPDIFSIKRFRKEAVSILFDRNASQANFPGNVPPHLLQGGEQDRLSVLWQLLSVARAAPAHFKPGSAWTFYVLGQRDGEAWTFQVSEAQRMRTPLGEVDVLHVVRILPENSGSQQLDIWLAPRYEWFPVKLRISETNGDYIEQNIERISKK